jgi:Methane oxygenase PmoA
LTLAVAIARDASNETEPDMRDSAAILTTASTIAALLVLGLAFAKQNGAATPRIQILPNESARSVDVVIDGKPFTSYIWPDNLTKPVLYPLRAADGTVVSRGFPLEPRAGERVDHPHHVGLWFNYGNVNDFDFWNNSYAIKKEDAPKMGNILQRKVVSAKSGNEKGELTVETDWISGTQKLLLKEHTEFIFSGDKNSRAIDHITTLQAQDEKVVFHDDKEGMLGLRVTRALEMPSTTAEVFTDANGNPTTVAKLDNTGVTGDYLTSEGKKGDEAWSTRGRWCMLSGKVGDDPVTIAIFDNPKNPNFPTYWHARGYGLFAANPLGRSIFTSGKEPPLNFTIAPHESATFRYRVVIFSEIASPQTAEAEYQKFASTYR